MAGPVVKRFGCLLILWGAAPGALALSLGGFSGVAPVLPGYCVVAVGTGTVTQPCPAPGVGIIGSKQMGADLTWLGTSVDQQIGKAAAGIEAGQKLGIAAQARLANGEVARRNQSLRNQQDSQMRLWYQQLTGSMGGMPQACASTGVSNSILAGQGGVMNFNDGLENLESQWGAPTSTNALQRLDQIAQSRSETGQNQIYAPTSATSSAAYISMLTQGAPAVQVPTSKMSPITARTVEAKRAIWRSRESLATASLDHVAASHRASLPVTPWMRTAYQDLGEKAPAKVSARSLEALVANARFESPKWRSSVARMNSIGLLRQAAILLSDKVKLSASALRDEQRTLAILAAGLGDRLQAQRPHAGRYMALKNPVGSGG